jgi:hypothetical protein
VEQLEHKDQFMEFSSIALAAEQVRALNDDVRLVIAHPNYTQQHILLSLFPDGVYVRLDGCRLDRAALDEQVSAVTKAQGRTLAQASELILDECDRADESALHGLISGLLSSFTSLRVIVFSRCLLSELLEAGDLRAMARFVPTNQAMMLWDYAEQRSDQVTLLEVRSLGAGRVQLNGHPVDSWDGVLPRSLFFYLIDRGMITRSEIFETFWPNLTVREATNVFHVTKRKISQVLGVDLTHYGSGYYHITGDIQLSYDVSVFAQSIQDSAIADTPEAIAMLRQAVALYRGSFLSSINTDWVVERRQVLRTTYAEALETLAEKLLETGDRAGALGYYQRAAAAYGKRDHLAVKIARRF